jgi:predicted type IV restriction endonuclease
MDLELKIADLAKVIRDHREVLLTEEAAKTALVMPFIQALGYNVFSPNEVIPEFTCDVGTKKGEKVDYAICKDGKVIILIECKPANSDLNINHASQLFRYFATTEARLAILTNGVDYKFFSDIDQPNKMDQKPFFSINLEQIRKHDFKILNGFAKQSFDMEAIVAEAGNLKLQSLLAIELEKEFSNPSDDFIKIFATRVTNGRVTASIKEAFSTLIVNSINAIVRDRVNDRLTSALNASNPRDLDAEDPITSKDEVVTTQTELDGFNIVRAIASRLVSPERIVMRDQKSYCAILVDDNNRKSLARLHFNSEKTMHFGTFTGKDETRHSIQSAIDIYKYEQQILDRLKELDA